MKKVLEYIEYLTACANAISKGAKICLDSWPANSPFSNVSNKDTGHEFKE
jgi:hypothetical protein